MNLYPKEYITRVENISIEFLKKNNLKALILDVDNTLINYSQKMEESVVKWAKEMLGQGVKLYILSNTNNKQKILNVSGRLGIKYIYFAKKPLKSGFLKIQKELNIPSEEIGVVGDQIFTDVIGGNRCKMFTILVDPIEEKEFWYTAFKRPIEKRIVEKYQKNKQKSNKGEF